MDKYEYRLRSEEILNLIEQEDYDEAANIADTIDWRRVKSINMLLRVASVYRASHRNEDSRAVLQLAYDRYPTNRAVLYCLCEVSVELDDVVAAIEYYKEFVKQAPRDNGVFTLRYRILEAQEASLEERIELLEELKKRDYQEEWAYELAYLYHRVGLATKCVEECDDLILWFGDGPFVKKAMELKMLHSPLTSIQEKKYVLMQDSHDGYSVIEEETVEEATESVIPVDESIYENDTDINLDKEADEEIQDDMPMDAAVPVAKPRPIQDLSQYNTINLQKVVAESMRELFPDDEDIYAANKSEVEDIEYASKKLAERMANEQAKKELLEEEIISESEVTEDIEAIEDNEEIEAVKEVEEVEEFSKEESTLEPQPEELSFEEIEEKENSFNRQEETIVFETDTIDMTSISKIAQLTKDIYEVKPDGNTGAIRTVFVPEQKLEPVMPAKEDFLIKDPAIVGDEAYNTYDAPIPVEETDTNQETEDPVPFRPMTGQMNIEDVMKEWERLKEENEQKRKENVRELVLQQTGQILANFDQAIKEMEEFPEENTVSEEAIIESETEMIEEDQTLEEVCEVEDTCEETDEVEELEEIEEATVSEDMDSEPYEINDNLENEDVIETEAETELEPAKANVQDSSVTMNTVEINNLQEKIAEVTAKETKESRMPEVRKFTENENILFENYATTRKAKKQVVNTIDNMSLVAYTGNVIITGEEGMGTVTVAKNLLKCFKSIEPEFSGKTAKITGEELNQKNISEIFDKLKFGALIIGQANGMSEKTVFDITRLLNQEDTSIVIFLIDTKINIQKLFSKQAIISDYFNLRVDLAEMDNNELVKYAESYAHALEYSIDTLGTLALHTRIENIQGGNHVVTKDEVRDIVDEAIWKSKKSKLKNFVDILLAKRYDDNDMIVLRERDFM